MEQNAQGRFAIKGWDEQPFSEGKDVPKLTRALRWLLWCAMAAPHAQVITA